MSPLPSTLSPMPDTNTVRVRRWFVRCVDCLSVYALDMDVLPREYRVVEGRKVHAIAADCACGGSVEEMGYVRCTEASRLSTDIQRSPCDGRCTNARGPICDCPCGGANHGTHALVTIVRDAGPRPRLSGDPDEKAMLQAQEWRDTLAKVGATLETRHAPVLATKRAGRYVSDWRAYSAWAADVRNVGKARKARTHAGRMAVLAALLIEPAAPVRTPSILDVRSTPAAS